MCRLIITETGANMCVFFQLHTAGQERMTCKKVILLKQTFPASTVIRLKAGATHQ